LSSRSETQRRFLHVYDNALLSCFMFIFSGFSFPVLKLRDFVKLNKILALSLKPVQLASYIKVNCTSKPDFQECIVSFFFTLFIIHFQQNLTSPLNIKFERMTNGEQL